MKTKMIFAISELLVFCTVLTVGSPFENDKTTRQQGTSDKVYLTTNSKLKFDGIEYIRIGLIINEEINYV
jgi:hypothetical protein